MLVLTIDVGNTNLVFGVFGGDRLLAKWRLATNPKMTEDEIFSYLAPLLNIASINLDAIKGIIISCVVPSMLFQLKMLANKYFLLCPLVVGDERFYHPLKIDIEEPKKLGSDIIANSVAAYLKYKLDVMVIDFGTATTFTVTRANGKFLGGAIVPGIKTCFSSLFSATAMIPEIEFAKAEQAIGKNTNHAIQSGIYYGYIGLVRNVIKAMNKQLGLKLTVVATGGLSTLIAKEIPEIDFIDPELTLNGLKYLYELNERLLYGESNSA